MATESTETDGGSAVDGIDLHQEYEPEEPIHRAVNISYRRLQDRIKPVEHDELDIWKAEDQKTGQISRMWWDTPEKAIEILAKDLSNRVCCVNECMTYTGDEMDVLFCDEHDPDEYVECAVGGCEYPYEHTETVHCHSHTWELGREAVAEVPDAE